MEGRQITVLCVDDNSRLTAAWTRLFATQPDLRVVASFNSADELVAIAQAQQPQVVLLDMTMQGRDPIEAMAELSRTDPDIRVIACSGHVNPELVRRVLDAGGWGYVGKTEQPDCIMDAIRRVARGEMVIPGRESSP